MFWCLLIKVEEDVSFIHWALWITQLNKHNSLRYYKVGLIHVYIYIQMWVIMISLIVCVYSLAFRAVCINTFLSKFSLRVGMLAVRSSVLYKIISYITLRNSFLHYFEELLSLYSCMIISRQLLSASKQLHETKMLSRSISCVYACR